MRQAAPYNSGNVEEYYDYYPFGMAMRTMQVSNGARYTFTSKELDKEAGVNWHYFGARYYDAGVGRFLTPDRFADMYPSLTPYHYCANNPLLFVDVNGDSVAYFNQDGSFSRFADDGKKGWSGQTISYDDDGNLVVHNTFSFNDAKTDIQALRNGTISNVAFVSDDFIKQAMAESGVTGFHGLIGRYKFAYNEATGKMDYGLNALDAGQVQKNSFQVINGNAYNLADFGNFMWGHGMRHLGIPLGDALLGAHWNNARNGGSQKVSAYDFGPGTYGKPGLLDSAADQRAIVKGFLYNLLR